NPPALAGKGGVGPPGRRGEGVGVGSEGRRYTPARMELGRWVLRSLGVVAGVAVVTALIAILRGAVEVPNLAPIYLLAVILCSVSWGWWPALAAALLAFLAYNFFFVEPIHTLTIH